MPDTQSAGHFDGCMIGNVIAVLHQVHCSACRYDK